MGIYAITTLVSVIAIIILWNFIGSKNWGATSGKIEHIEILEIHNQSISEMSSGKPFTEYKIDVKYSYRARGKSYTGDKIYPLIPNVFSNKTDVEDILAKFKKGQEIAIYFNPEQPNISCLISSIGISNKELYIFALIALTLIGVTTIGIVYFNKIFSD